MIADLKPYPAYKESETNGFGCFPHHWHIRRLKSAVANHVDQTNRMEHDDVYVALEHVESWTGKVRPQTDANLFTGQVKRFRSGDVLFGKLRPYLAKATRLSVGGVCAGEFFVFRPTDPTLQPAYLELLIRSRLSIDLINSSTFGAKMPRADWQFVGNMRIPLPPPAEQAAIVRFLDHWNGRLEKAIRSKRRVIALLQEQKQAIIHRAVTRGLDPDVKLKDSGIPWLGGIPAHWEIWRISRFARVGNGSTPSRAKPAYWTGGLYPWLNSSQVNRGFIDSSDQFVTHIALRECHLPKVPAGSVLVAITGQGKTRGMSAVLGVEATINQHIAFITPRIQIASPDFIHLALSAAYLQLRAASEDAGSTKGAITCEDLKRFKIAVPPRIEQEALLKTVQAETATLTTAIARFEREITLLREYRTRLTADVVTGKLDVRAAAAQLPDSEQEPAVLEAPEEECELEEVEG